MSVAILVVSQELIWGMYHAGCSIGRKRHWCHAAIIIGSMHNINVFAYCQSEGVQLGALHIAVRGICYFWHLIKKRLFGCMYKLHI